MTDLAHLHPAAAPPAIAARPADATERFHALDAVRGYALLLGILFHATMSFLVSPGQAWLIADSSLSTTLTVVFYVLHIFRMATFFLIAGFFAHLTFHRWGARPFVRDRLRRIGLPLLAGWPIAIASIIGCAIWGAWLMNGGQMPEAPPAEGSAPFLAFPLTHLWFLYVLLWLYAGTLGARGLLTRLGGWPALRTRLDRAMAALVSAPPGLVLLALPTWLGLLAVPNWQPWLGVPTPDQTLLPNIAAVAAFGSTFAFGWLLHRQPQLLQVLERRAHGHLLLAVGLTAACLWHVGLQVDATIASIDAATTLYAAGYALALWAWSFAFIGLALRYLSGYSARRRYIADASYWMYLVHLPLVLVLQILFSQFEWHWTVKLPLILGIATALMLASYRGWVRGTAIGAVLNGRRLPPA
jgi:glucan biosynthesis protein C